jgi:hypothetical protein
MKTILSKITISMLVAASAFVSCKKEEKAVSAPLPGNEFLTTVKIRFQNTANAADTVWAVWKDLSNGTNPPDTSKAIINIKKSSTYKASVYFFDDTKNPAVDITPSIRERANYHSYWFFQSGGIVGSLTITPTDFDNNKPPLVLGLESDFVTSAVTTTTANPGRLEGILRHQPNSKNGTFAPGSSDSDVFFTLNIIP